MYQCQKRHSTSAQLLYALEKISLANSVHLWKSQVNLLLLYSCDSCQQLWQISAGGVWTGYALTQMGIIFRGQACLNTKGLKTTTIPLPVHIALQHLWHHWIYTTHYILPPAWNRITNEMKYKTFFYFIFVHSFCYCSQPGICWKCNILVATQPKSLDDFS